MASIVIIDNQLTVQNSLSAALHKHFSMASVHATSVENAERFLVERPGIDLIIFDPTSNGTQQAFNEFFTLQRRAQQSKILLHSGYMPADFNLLACLAAGARGFLSKGAGSAEYLRAISVVMEGRTYLASEVKAEMVRLLITYKNTSKSSAKDIGSGLVA